MARFSRTSESERGESPSERADRNFSELVQEVRVAQTGVQILFAFLLTLAFYESFPQDPAFSYVLIAALLAAAASTVCFLAPVAAHRVTFRTGGKERLVWVTHRLAMTGLAMLGLSMLLAIWLVVAFLFGLGVATLVVVALGLVVLGMWVVLPWRLRTDE